MPKGTERRTERLSIRVPLSLKEALEREAARDRRTSADLAIILLTDGLKARSRKGAGRG